MGVISNMYAYERRSWKGKKISFVFCCGLRGTHQSWWSKLWLHAGKLCVEQKWQITYKSVQWLPPQLWIFKKNSHEYRFGLLKRAPVGDYFPWWINAPCVVVWILMAAGRCFLLTVVFSDNNGGVWHGGVGYFCVLVLFRGIWWQKQWCSNIFIKYVTSLIHMCTFWWLSHEFDSKSKKPWQSHQPICEM